VKKEGKKRGMAECLEGGDGRLGHGVAKFGVLTVSDRASAGVYADESGPEILKFFKQAIASR